MKKLLAILLALAMIFAMAACASSSDDSSADAGTTPDTNVNDDANTDAGNEDEGTEEVDLASLVSADINDLMLYVDGADVTDGNVAFAQFADKFSVVEVDGVSYYATTLANLCPYDISSVQAFFGETTDGFIRYYTDLENAYVAVLQSEDGENFAAIDNEGAAAYAMVLPEGNIINGLANVYMLTTPAAFSVPIKLNGEEIGQLTLADFMKKTAIGDDMVKTAMYDGSFKYKGGEATYNGRFLGIDYETMLAKLAGLGMVIEGEIVEVEFYGTPGMGEPGKNGQYAVYPDEDSYFKNVEFFCMYDGMVNNTAIKDIDMGLSVFINGSGQKWVTYALTEINFITE